MAFFLMKHHDNTTADLKEDIKTEKCNPDNLEEEEFSHAQEKLNRILDRIEETATRESASESLREKAREMMDNIETATLYKTGSVHFGLKRAEDFQFYIIDTDNPDRVSFDRNQVSF